MIISALSARFMDLECKESQPLICTVVPVVCSPIIKDCLSWQIRNYDLEIPMRKASETHIFHAFAPSTTSSPSSKDDTSIDECRAPVTPLICMLYVVSAFFCLIGEKLDRNCILPKPDGLNVCRPTTEWARTSVRSLMFHPGFHTNHELDRSCRCKQVV